MNGLRAVWTSLPFYGASFECEVNDIPRHLHSAMAMIVTHLSGFNYQDRDGRLWLAAGNMHKHHNHKRGNHHQSKEHVLKSLLCAPRLCDIRMFCGPSALSCKCLSNSPCSVSQITVNTDVFQSCVVYEKVQGCQQLREVFISSRCQEQHARLVFLSRGENDICMLNDYQE